MKSPRIQLADEEHIEDMAAKPGITNVLLSWLALLVVVTIAVWGFWGLLP